MKKYDEYKDSGVSWIGEIPKDWEVRRFRYSFNTRTGLTITRGELLENGVPCINYGEIHSKYGFDLDIERDVLKNAPVELLKNKSNALVDENDFIFCDTSEDIVGSGNNVYIKSTCDKNMFAGSHTIIAHPIIKVYARYLAYLFSTQEWRSQIRSRVYGVKVFSITQTILKDAGLILPPKEIQHSIADYLDQKTAVIDSLIEDKQKLIELLKEKRQAIISEAVTKGLDKNAKMKDSGIEWIGEIPEGWTCTSLGKISKIVTGNTPSKNGIENYYDDNFGMLWIKPDNLNGFIDIIDTKEKLTNDGEKLARVIEPYTPLVCCIGTIGKFGYCSTKAAYNQQINAVNFNNTIMQWKFGLYAISSQIEQHLFYSNGNVVNILNTENQKKIKIAVPPVNEQNSIVPYLDNKTADIDKLVADITAQIEKLKEYRQAIISEAVTGKVAI